MGPCQLYWSQAQETSPDHKWGSRDHNGSKFSSHRLLYSSHWLLSALGDRGKEEEVHTEITPCPVVSHVLLPSGYPLTTHAGIFCDPRILYLFTSSQTSSVYSARYCAKDQRHRNEQDEIFILGKLRSLMRELDFSLRNGRAASHARKLGNMSCHFQIKENISLVGISLSALQGSRSHGKAKFFNK